MDLRKVNLSAKDAFKNISDGIDVSLWPSPQPHAGSTVLVCYTVAESEINGMVDKRLNFNVLWVGVLKGDSTLNK